MTFTIEDKKRIANLINAYGNTSLKKGDIEIDYENKPYYNLISALYEIEEIRRFYDEDIAIYGINTEILKRHKYLPIEIKFSEINEIVDNVVETLKRNVADHLIIVPIQYAQFKNKIKFGNLLFIPQDISRRDKLKIIARLSKKTLAETVWIAEHTEKSRSPDFFKYPLLCIRQTHQTRTVHYNSLNISKIIIYSLRCYYFGYIRKTSKDKTSILVSMGTQSQKIASHIAIYSKENWRQNHKPLNFDVSFPFDLSWLEETIEQRRFNKFLNQLYLKGSFDDFNMCFLNALTLFNDSIKQNNSISTIITMTIAESILTRNKNEKRLRISAIIPRLLKFNRNEYRRISMILDELYKKRNNFVHSGESVTISYDTETLKPTILEEGREIVAKLILQYPNFRSYIEKHISNENGKNNSGLKMETWEKYVDSIFQGIIYG